MPEQPPRDQFTRLALEIYNTPLLIEQSRLDPLLTMAVNRDGVEPSALYFFFDPPESKDLDIREGVAVIAVSGYLGSWRYKRIQTQLQRALETETVRAILFNISSGGGSVSGAFDLADFIHDARGQKPMWAIANDDAFSAAYGLASSADRIAVTRTGGIGSVGVIAIHVEYSEMDKRVGVKFTPIYAGARKKDYIDTEPLNAKARDLLQAEVDRIREIFVETVARNRKLSEDVVRKTEAALFFGPQGEPQFSDTVAKFDDFLAELQESVVSQLGGTTSTASHDSVTMEEPAMANDKPTGTEGAEAPETPIPAAPAAPAAAAESADVISIDEAKKSGRAEAQAEAKERTAAIRMLCNLAKCPERFGEFLESDLTPEAVGKKLVEEAASNAADHVDGHFDLTGIELKKIDPVAIYRKWNTEHGCQY